MSIAQVMQDELCPIQNNTTTQSIINNRTMFASENIPNYCQYQSYLNLFSVPQAPSYYFCFVRQAVLWNRGQHHTVSIVSEHQ